MTRFVGPVALSMMMLMAAPAWGSTLSPGDVVIVGFNFDNPDDFGFAVLVDLEAGTEVYFTDSGVTAEGTFRGGEGAVKYTVPPDGLTSGSVVIYSADHLDFVPANDSHVGTGGLALSSSGDQIIAFQDSSASPRFIYALNSEGNGWQSDASSSNETVLPPGLTDGSSGLALNETDNGYYSGPVTQGTRAELLDAISLEDNWITANARMETTSWVQSLSVLSSLSPGTTVQFASPADSVPEGASAHQLTVSIANESDSSETTADVVLTSEGTAENGRDIWWYAARTMTFPAGDSSSQTVTVTLLEDGEFEGTETLVFELQNISGGHQAGPGYPDRFTLMIEDNDPPPLVINEIHYNPSADQGSDDQYEFLELYNRSTYTADLSDYRFRDGIEHSFGASDSLAPGAYLVVAKRGTTYPGSIEWSSGNLTNDGEALVLVTGRGIPVDSVMYAAVEPWPVKADGRGSSMELVDPFLDNSRGEAWQASFVNGGTPGEINSSNSGPEAFDLVTPQDSAVIIITQDFLTEPFIMDWENSQDGDGDSITYELTATGGLSFLGTDSIQKSCLSVTYGEMVSDMIQSDRVEGDWTVVASDGVALKAADNGPFHLTLDASSLVVTGTATVPGAFRLHPNVPNPFNTSTLILYDVPRMSEVRIDIYDPLGRRVQVLASGIHSPGVYAKIFRGTNATGADMATGIYLCRMVAHDTNSGKTVYRRTGKLVFMK